jgi:hypothetical protein
VAAAICELQPVGDEAVQLRYLIAELLGFESLRETVAPEKTGIAPPPVPHVELPQPEPVHGPAKPPPMAESTPAQAAARRWLPSTLQTRKPDEPARDAATLLAHIPPLPPPRQAALELTEMNLADPLFDPACSRAIFTVLLATFSDGGIDLEALIEKVARREHIDRLPAQTIPTLRRGAQVLVDTSKGMEPFIADQAWALDEIERIVGRDLVRVLSFTGLPARGLAAGFVNVPQAYLPPLPGTPVILLSDLGIARPIGASERASGEEWAAFARGVRHAGCRLIALLPYASARWPRELRGLVTMIEWNPRTTAGRLRTIIDRGHHVD